MIRPIFGDNIYLGECEIGTFLEILFFGIFLMKKSFSILQSKSLIIPLIINYITTIITVPFYGTILQFQKPISRLKAKKDLKKDLKKRVKTING